MKNFDNTTENAAESFTELSNAELNINAYTKKIGQYRDLTAEEEKSLAKLVKEGSQDAKKMLIKCNLKLVVNLARKMLHSGNLSVADLIQEGNIGLITAVDKFNYKLGYRFSTYASWWIKQAMFKAISEQSHGMKIPVYIQETISKYKKLKSEMEKNGNDTVSTEKVAEKMNMDAEKINIYLNAFCRMLSLDGDFENQNQDSLSLSEVIEDKNASAQEIAEYNALTDDINSILNTLKERECKVIKMRFGLGDEQRQTLEEIGKLYGVTKECIRQTELRALKKLKNIQISEMLYATYIN